VLDCETRQPNRLSKFDIYIRSRNRARGRRGHSRCSFYKHTPVNREKERWKRDTGRVALSPARYILITRYGEIYLPPLRGNLFIVDQDYALEAATLRGDNAPIGHTRRFRLGSRARACTCGRIPESSARPCMAHMAFRHRANPILSFSLAPSALSSPWPLRGMSLCQLA